MLTQVTLQVFHKRITFNSFGPYHTIKQPAQIGHIPHHFEVLKQVQSSHPAQSSIDDRPYLQVEEQLKHSQILKIGPEQKISEKIQQR